jgi:hypothetical protein
MPEPLFLCGLSKTQRAQYRRGRELQLVGPLANVRLKVNDIRRHLIDNEADLLTDLMEIAIYVFAADCAVRRGGPFLKDMGRYWRRNFHLVIAVRQPGRWSEPERLFALREALEFMSEDTWDFEFLDLESPAPIQEYMNYGDTNADRSGGSTIILFSGGLDSFAGAVHELSTSNRHVVLISRRLRGMTDARQRELASILRQRHPRRVTHVPVSAGLTDDAKACEHTQRTRSFLLTALAIVAAAIEESDRVCLYENGIMSINLPISTQVVGARASRSTHPRSLMLLNQLARHVGEHQIAINNPFIWLTKVEVVRGLCTRPEAGFIRGTFSCSNTRHMSSMTPHCGKCAQCLHRRISTLAAGAADADPGEGYAVDMLIGPRDKDEDLVMAIDIVRSAFEYRRLSDADFAVRFANELAWLTTSFHGIAPPEVAQRTIAMFKRHGDALRDIFVRATGEYAAALVEGTLPDNCLLRAVLPVADMTLEETPIVGFRPPDVQSSGDAEESDGTARAELLIAVDHDRNWVMIEGQGPIAGGKMFHLTVALIELHCQDREEGRRPENYRSLTASELADRLALSNEEGVRQTVSRIRKELKKGCAALGQPTPTSNQLIENVHRQGYRINPARVRVVAPGEIRGA